MLYFRVCQKNRLRMVFRTVGNKNKIYQAGRVIKGQAVLHLIFQNIRFIISRYNEGKGIGTPVFRRFPAGLQACNHPEEHSIAQVGVYQNENQTVENVYWQALQWSPGFGVKNKCKKLEEVETIVLKN